MKDNIGQDLEIGDSVVYASYANSTLSVGIVVKRTPSGSLTICRSIGRKTWVTPNVSYPCLDTQRKAYVKIPEDNLEEEQKEKLNKIREYYGYTRNRVNG